MARASGGLTTANRFLAAIGGGFVFANGLVAIATLAGLKLGMRFSDAQALMWMLGLLVYLGAVLWGFATRKTDRVWLVLGGGGVAMGALAWALSRLTI